MIRNAQLNDLETIQTIYAQSRVYMVNHGNPNQWPNTYPSDELLISDILKRQLYIYLVNDQIHGVFAFIEGEDLTYAHIEDGKWMNNAPYKTIHRIASDGNVKGVFKTCIDYCKNHADEIRIDTHKDNKIMQALIHKSEFIYCGIIYVQNHSPRLAYHYSKNKRQD